MAFSWSHGYEDVLCPGTRLVAPRWGQPRNGQRLGTIHVISVPGLERESALFWKLISGSLEVVGPWIPRVQRWLLREEGGGHVFD